MIGGMQQLLNSGDMVEVLVEKISLNGIQVRILNPSERSHQQSPNMKSVHLSSLNEAAIRGKLQQYAATNFKHLPSCSVDKMLKQLVVYRTREKTFARGIVEKRKDQTTSDFLVRNMDTRVLGINIHFEDMRLLPEPFGVTVWPPSTLQFQLAQVKPITMELRDGMPTSRKCDSEKWDTAALQLVRQLVKESVVVCKVENMDSDTGVFHVMMWSQRPQQGKNPEAVININEELVKKEFARVDREETIFSTSSRRSVAKTESPSKASSSISTASVPVDSSHRLGDGRSSGGGSSGNFRGGATSSPSSSTRANPASFNINSFKRPLAKTPLILGCKDLSPVSTIESCNFYSKIKEQYMKGRGTSHTDLSLIQRYGWPFFEKERDGVLVFPPDNTLRPELTFLIPMLSVLTKGTYARCPKNYSPKVLIIVPSCEDADLLTDYCRESLDESLKYALNVRKAYAISKFAPHTELYNNQDLLVITPESLISTYKEHVSADGRSKYFSNTFHVVLHKSHDLFTRHRNDMQTILTMLRDEVNEQDYSHKCQIVMFSDVWLPVYHAVIRTYMSEPITVIQNRTECALHSGMTAHVEEFQNSQLKLDSFISTVKKLCDSRKKMAIFVRSSGGQLVEALTCKAVPCYELDDLGTQIEKWSRGCAMVISDTVAAKYIIPDCDILLNYDVPDSLESFNNRLSFLDSHFTGLLSAKDYHSIFFLAEEEELQRVNNLVKYLSRYSVQVPASLKEKADKGEKLRQTTEKKSKSLCPYLLQYGACSLRHCSMRHAVLEEDAPGSSLRVLNIPLKGKIQVKITAVADGNRFYGRLLSVNSGTCVNSEEEFQAFHQKVQGWFTDKSICIDEDKLREELREVEGSTEVTVGVKNKSDNMLYRARVKSLRYNADILGRLDGVIAQCLDTGEEGLYPLETVYRFPRRLALQPAYATEIIVCGVKPAENDRHFASYCKVELNKRILGEVLEGNIELALGNCLWVRSLEKRQLLKNLKLMSSELSVKKVIMDNKFGAENNEQIKLLRAAVREALPQAVPEDNDVIASRVTMETGTRHVVCVSHVESPHNFYVNVLAYMGSLEEVEEQINEVQFLDSILPCWLPKDTFCIARFSKDNRWYRAEIKRTWHDKYHVHFVDYGNEDRAVPSNFVKTIPQHLLELPFQAVYCSLADIEPIKLEWDSSDQTTMTELTVEEDFHLDLVAGPDENNKYTVELFYDDQMPLVDILCRDHVGLNTKQVTNSAFHSLFDKLYRSDDDYLLLCTAESLEADIASPGCRVETGDLATVCRLCKLRSEDDNVMVHLISALNLIILGRADDEWSTELVEEELLVDLIKKLSSPSPTHKAVADLLSTVGKNKSILRIIADTQCIVSLCELCVYKQEQSLRLVSVLNAIKTLTTLKVEEGDVKGGSDHIRKEIMTTGHLRTLMKFLRDSSDECLDQVLVLFGTMLEAEGCRAMFRTFKEEGGLRDVCRATKRTKSPAVIGLIELFEKDCKESLTLMKKEGLAGWFKELSEKRRDLETRLACRQFYKMISSHQFEEENKDEFPDPPVPAPMTRAPIMTAIDEPVRIKEGMVIEHHTREPNILWYQRKRLVAMSIQLKDVGKHELKIEGNRTLIFSTWHSGTLYRFRYNLFDDIKLMTSQVKSSEVLVSLTKKSLERWSNLLEWKRENVKLDFSRACDSEDETDSEAETEPPQEPLFCRDDVEVCIGGDGSDSDGYVPEEDEIGDDFSSSFFHDFRVKVDSDDMDGLE